MYWPLCVEVELPYVDHSISSFQCPMSLNYQLIFHTLENTKLPSSLMQSILNAKRYCTRGPTIKKKASRRESTYGGICEDLVSIKKEFEFRILYSKRAYNYHIQNRVEYAGSC